MQWRMLHGSHKDSPDSFKNAVALCGKNRLLKQVESCVTLLVCPNLRRLAWKNRTILFLVNLSFCSPLVAYKYPLP